MISSIIVDTLKRAVLLAVLFIVIGNIAGIILSLL